MTDNDTDGAHNAGSNLRHRLTDARSPLRFSADYWSSRFHARRTCARLSAMGIAIEWGTEHDQVDGARRAGTLALRSARPKDPALIAKRIATVAYAIDATTETAREEQALLCGQRPN